MRLDLSPLLLALALCSTATDAAAAAASTNTSTNSTNGSKPEAIPWKVCTVHNEFECTQRMVPFCYDLNAPCAKKTHSLVLQRRETAESLDAPTLWLATDATSTELAALMMRLSKLRTFNVYTLESRLWENIPYDSVFRNPCTSLVFDFPFRLRVDSPLLTALGACQSWADSKFGPQGLHTFSLDSAARDLESAITTVQRSRPTSPQYVYASGKGTRVVQRLITLPSQSKTPRAITGYILDGPQLMALDERAEGDALTRFVAGCDTDTVCGAKFKKRGISMSDALHQIYAMMDDNTTTTIVNATDCVNQLSRAAFEDARDLKPSHGVRRLLARMRSVSPSAAQAIAPIVYRTHRCRYSDKEALSSMYLALPSLISKGEKIEYGLARVVEYVTMFSDLWPTSADTREKLVKDFESSLISSGKLVLQMPNYCALSGSTSSACQAVYKLGVEMNSSLSITHTRTATVMPATAPTTPSAHLLVLASRLDPTGAGFASSKLYEQFTAIQAAGKPAAILVQSDRLSVGPELSSTASDPLFRVVELFVTSSAVELSGQWHLNDLNNFDLGGKAGSAKAVTSTLATTVPMINFTMTESSSWFDVPDPYEGYRVRGRGVVSEDDDKNVTSSPSPSTDSNKIDFSTTALPLMGFFGFIGMVMGLWVSYMRSQRAVAARHQQQEQYDRLSPRVPPIERTREERRW